MYVAVFESILSRVCVMRLWIESSLCSCLVGARNYHENHDGNIINVEEPEALLSYFLFVFQFFQVLTYESSYMIQKKIFLAQLRRMNYEK